jgi:transcriptional regulator of NAD metabolism
LANATDAFPPESREEKIRQSSFQVVRKISWPCVKLQVSQTMFMQQGANDVQVAFNHRKLGNVLKHKKRVDEVTLTYVMPGPLQEILRAGDGKEGSILNAIVPREGNSPLYHPVRNVHSHYLLETTRERNDKSSDAAPQFQAKKAPHLIQLEEREKLPLNRAHATLPEFASVGSFQRSQDIGVRILLRKFLPFFAAGLR